MFGLGTRGSWLCCYKSRSVRVTTFLAIIKEQFLYLNLSKVLRPDYRLTQYHLCRSVRFSKLWVSLMCTLLCQSMYKQVRTTLTDHRSSGITSQVSYSIFGKDENSLVSLYIHSCASIYLASLLGLEKRFMLYAGQIIRNKVQKHCIHNEITSSSLACYRIKCYWVNHIHTRKHTLSHTSTRTHPRPQQSVTYRFDHLQCSDYFYWCGSRVD